MKDAETLAATVREALDAWAIKGEHGWEEPFTALDSLLALLSETQAALRTEVRLREELEDARRAWFADPEAALRKWADWSEPLAPDPRLAKNYRPS